MAQGRAQGMAQGIEQGKAQGIEEGRAQGEKSALYKVVEKMKKMGMTDTQIVEATGLTLQQVEQCQK
ncbi:MAG TPA: hypothetical protein DEQ17_00495, partial [Prevotella sp.]|nr:hypothetical protein [Prevotella sp.]